eukprot:m.115334 g.115334  ORF g.115334 m.115334 type:complete len:452 (-) comp28414_c1_seq1:213-1568(-)
MVSMESRLDKRKRTDADITHADPKIDGTRSVSANTPGRACSSSTDGVVFQRRNTSDPNSKLSNPLTERSAQLSPTASCSGRETKQPMDLRPLESSNSNDDVMELLDKVELLISGAVPTMASAAIVEAAVSELVARDVCGSDLDIVEYARYMLAIAYLCMGRARFADPHIVKLGLLWRLSHKAFYHRDGSILNASDTLAHQKSRGILSKVKVWDHALPQPLLQSLQRGFSPLSKFWTAHGYDKATCSFYSYMYQLKDEPKTSIELAIQHLRSVLSKTIPEIATATAVEWWAHKRDVSTMWSAGMHALHFDTDEQTFSDDVKAPPLRHPVYSSVLYLQDVGGPTLVSDKIPGTGGLGEQGCLVWPERNRYMCFPGNLLHGVLPDCSSPRSLAPASMPLQSSAHTKHEIDSNGDIDVDADADVDADVDAHADADAHAYGDVNCTVKFLEVLRLS